MQDGTCGGAFWPVVVALQLSAIEPNRSLDRLQFMGVGPTLLCGKAAMTCSPKRQRGMSVALAVSLADASGHMVGGFAAKTRPNNVPGAHQHDSSHQSS